MQKISHSTLAATPAGEFTEGSPVGGIPATPIKAAWLNAIQRELVGLVEGAGLALDSEEDDQVLAAVQRLVADANTWASITAKPSTLAGFGIGDAFSKSETSTNIQAAINALIASSPTALNTLNKLAGAVGNDANFATTVSNALALKAPLASPALSGVPTAPTAAVGSNTTQLATTAFVEAARPSKTQCSAWVNFNGTGTVAIRDSFNVSSITDNGTGDYTVNFASPMNSANYCHLANFSESTTTPYATSVARAQVLTTSIRLTQIGSNGGGGVFIDWADCNVQVTGGK